MNRPGAVMNMLGRILRAIFRLLYGVEVRGDFQPHDRMLIVANHQSFLDPILLGAFLPVWPTYLVHTTIAQRWYFRIGLKFFPHAVTDTTKPMAMKTLLAVIESGQPAIIFPEGRITVTGSLMKIYDGPAFVAARTGCAVVPVHIEGAVYSPFSKTPFDLPHKWFPRIAITICPAVTIAMPPGRRARDRRRGASEELRRVMQHAAYLSRKRSTLFEALLDTADLHGFGKPVIEDVNTNFAPVPFRAIIKGALALAWLTGRYTRDRENVGVLMPNANATVALLFGLTAIRRVPAMLNYTAGVRGVEAACRVADIRFVLTSRAFIEKAGLEDLIARLTAVRIVYLEDLRSEVTLSAKISIALGLLNPRRRILPARPDDPALIMFTSGSEGIPKGVVLSHDSILANVAQINAAIPFSSRDRFMSALPLFHAFGITAGVLVPVLKGCPVVLYPSPLHYRNVPEFIYDHDCTVLFTTNTFLSKYAQAAHPYDFYNLHYLIVGAEKLTEDVRNLVFDKFGLRVIEGYGATECSPVISVNTPLAYRAGTVGELLPGMEHRCVPVAGIETGGVLHVTGGNVMLGYLRSEQPGVIQPVASECGPGWYSTGDIVTVDNRYVTIHARLKRFAKVAGEMVPLDFVERIASDARPSAVHAAVALRDPARGESIILYTDAEGLTRDELSAAARRLGASELALPRRVVVLDDIPVLGNGKKDYVSLSAMAAGALAPPRQEVDA
jgi:acyl-[acyl-carrier-protein]-phospholipid O-acyltransferase/long-chain-fatty-acid--[acyl-carrier-protein] ligase